MICLAQGPLDLESAWSVFRFWALQFFIVFGERIIAFEILNQFLKPRFQKYMILTFPPNIDNTLQHPTTLRIENMITIILAAAVAHIISKGKGILGSSPCRAVRACGGCTVNGIRVERSTVFCTSQAVNSSAIPKVKALPMAIHSRLSAGQYLYQNSPLMEDQMNIKATLIHWFWEFWLGVQA